MLDIRYTDHLTRDNRSSVMNPKPRFFRYLPRNPNGGDWGASVLDAGHGTVPPDSEYPLPGHPDDHLFSWEKGRCLEAYTFVYITAGHGIFDSEPSGEVPVSAGSVFVVFPNVWHRYRPDTKTGWDEYWVECEGTLLEAAVERCGLNPSTAVMRVGHDDALLRCFINIADTIQEESPGFEPIIAMRSLEIVARIRSLLKVSSQDGSTALEKMVKHAQVKMREALNSNIDFHHLASELGMSYSTFRRIFKKETGLPPGEYFIAMKMNRAKQLLMTDKTIQEVADQLGFESVYYFSRLFKARTGASPSAFRPDRDNRAIES
jgi:AraC-like DNA-binding protein/mannose-6-phosphate isomerase-like protein (cupin superfamily)